LNRQISTNTDKHTLTEKKKARERFGEKEQINTQKQTDKEIEEENTHTNTQLKVGLI
jgi:hypothetical protein